MNNEPVGYFLYNEEYKEWEETHAGTPNSVPLYIHPVNPYKAITDTKIEPTVVNSAQYVEEAPYHPGYEDAAMQQDIEFHKHPVFVGCWTIGGNFSIFATKRPTDEQIQHTIDYFGWTWTDGSLEEQLKGRQ